MPVPRPFLPVPPDAPKGPRTHGPRAWTTGSRLKDDARKRDARRQHSRRRRPRGQALVVSSTSSSASRPGVLRSNFVIANRKTA
ncbi:hypothetical protein SHIRM173S_01685 [Streptomyces hirsutus]